MNIPFQRGSVLIVSMLMLLVLTIIGITAMSTSTLEEKMAGNSRDQNLAFQAAEAALRDGETLAEGLVSTATFTAACPNGLCAQGTNPDVLAAATWSSGNSQATTSTLTGVSKPPRFIVEVVSTTGSGSRELESGYGGASSEGRITNFRITAQGTGGTDNAVVTLQSNYGKRL